MAADDFIPEPIQPKKLPHEIAASILKMPIKFGEGEAELEEYLKCQSSNEMLKFLPPNLRAKQIAEEKSLSALHQALTNISQGKIDNIGMETIKNAIPFIGAKIADAQDSVAHAFSTTASPEEVDEFTKMMKEIGEVTHTDEDTRAFHTEHGYAEQRQAQYLTTIQSALIDLNKSMRGRAKS